MEKKINDHNHDKYITTPEFNKLAADAFNARLPQVNSIKKRILIIKCQVLIEKLSQIKRKT